MRRASALLLCVCVPVVACAHASAEDRHLAGMGDEISRVQADHDDFDKRAAGSDGRDSDDHSATAAQKPGAPPPPPRVVRLENDPGDPARTGDGARTSDDPDDSAPRPVIRVQGTGGRGKGRSGDPVIEETLPDEDARAAPAGPAITQGAAKPSALDPDARRAYDAALAMVNAKRYGAALDGFAAFLVRWPDHPFADNATYWRGECYFAQGEFARAAEQFEGVIARFPLGNKVPDAWLKLGFSAQKLGNPAKAKDAFEKLEHGYPKSDAARRIPRTENP